MSNMHQLCGLWRTKKEGSKVVASGKILGLSVMIMKNDKKEEGSNKPDYHLVLAQDQPRSDSNEGGNGSDLPF